MKPELTWLLWAVALTFVQVLVAVAGAQMRVGLPMLVANRENLGTDHAGWVGRAQRAHRNMLESMVLFAPMVLIAVVAGKTNSATLLGVQLFVWARVVYALVYYAGIPWLRTGVWFAAVVGMGMIFVQLV